MNKCRCVGVITVQAGSDRCITCGLPVQKDSDECREFCKQHLLPRTGDAELDALIRQARLQEFAKVAMGALIPFSESDLGVWVIAGNARDYAKALAAKLDEESSDD